MPDHEPSNTIKLECNCHKCYAKHGGGICPKCRCNKYHDFTPVTTSELVAYYGDFFSLTCAGCDAGEEIHTPEQAVKAGWGNILHDPDGMSWNYTGKCAECLLDENDTREAKVSGQRPLFV